LSELLSHDLAHPEELEILRAAAEPHAADVLGDRLPYKLRNAEHEGDAIQHALFAGIQLDDELLIRGLSCLLNSNGLMRHQTCGEEAFMNVQIAREAALELIREHLQELGVPSPSYADAHVYVRDHFKLGNHLAEYFEDQHDQWVLTRHPKSKHGVFW